MNEEQTVMEETRTTDERVLASLAHGSILLGLFTNGLGGIATSLAIWLTQREKSDYVARQALQALVYQIATFVITLTAFSCWGLTWLGLTLPPLLVNGQAYQNAPPPGMFAGLGLLFCPLALGLITILYSLFGALRCLSGHEFEYIIVGSWLARQR